MANPRTSSGEALTKLPEGFRYRSELIGPVEEAALLTHVRELPFREFKSRGYAGRRRVVSFGWHYDFTGREFRKADDIPDFPLALRLRVRLRRIRPG